MHKRGYPDRLISLLDYDGACVAAVEQAPVRFSIKLVKPDGSSSIIAWTADDESLARKEVLGGELKAYYMFNANHALACCGQPKYGERPDWNAALDLNLKLAISCSKSGADVLCKQG
jgi:hypothetical protein